MSTIGVPDLMIIFMIVGMGSVLLVWPAARICKRIGFSPWLGVLAALPIANVILLWVVAFVPWPGPPPVQRGA